MNSNNIEVGDTALSYGLRVSFEVVIKSISDNVATIIYSDGSVGIQFVNRLILIKKGTVVKEETGSNEPILNEIVENSNGTTRAYYSKRSIGTAVKEFKKSDLVSGKHFVRYRDGDFRVVLGDVFSGIRGYALLSSYDDYLISPGIPDTDIIAVYEASCHDSIKTYLRGVSLKEIWRRVEKSPKQIKLDELIMQSEKLNAEIAKLKGNIDNE